MRVKCQKLAKTFVKHIHWSEAAAVKKCTQDVATDFVFNQVICHYAGPLEVITDQGSHFQILLAYIIQKPLDAN